MYHISTPADHVPDSTPADHVPYFITGGPCTIFQHRRTMYHIFQHRRTMYHISTPGDHVSYFNTGGPCTIFQHRRTLYRYYVSIPADPVQYLYTRCQCTIFQHRRTVHIILTQSDHVQYLNKYRSTLWSISTPADRAKSYNIGGPSKYYQSADRARFLTIYFF